MYDSEGLLAFGIFLFMLWGLYSLYKNLWLERDNIEVERYLIVVVENQELIIEGILREVLVLQQQLGNDTYLIIVDVSSQDRTLEIIEKITYPDKYFSLIQVKDRQELEKVFEKYKKENYFIVESNILQNIRVCKTALYDKLGC